MPRNFLNADTAFPQFTDGQSSEDKISAIQNYLYMLLEQLRYTLANLGQQNFNGAELTNIAGIITEPVYARLEDAETGLSTTLRLTPGGLQITDANGDAVTIDGGQIDADTLHLTGSINIADKFSVNHDGTITWTSDNSPVQVKYSADGNGTPLTQPLSWHDDFMPATDKFASYSYDGGRSWILNAVKVVGTDGTNGSSPSLPTYIKTNYIGQTTIASPRIYGGLFYATGQGYDQEAAYYIYDGCGPVQSDGTAALGTLKGYLSYDSHGANTDEEAQTRVLLTTVDGAALKIKSAGNMSLSSAQTSGFVHIGSELIISKTVRLTEDSYGPALPTTGEEGQLFFKTS